MAVYLEAFEFESEFPRLPFIKRQKQGLKSSGLWRCILLRLFGPWERSHYDPSEHRGHSFRLMTQSHNPEYSNPQQHRYENLKYCKEEMNLKLNLYLTSLRIFVVETAHFRTSNSVTEAEN
jgi:hypothetical protein